MGKKYFPRGFPSPPAVSGNDVTEFSVIDSHRCHAAGHDVGDVVRWNDVFLSVILTHHKGLIFRILAAMHQCIKIKNWIFIVKILDKSFFMYYICIVKGRQAQCNTCCNMAVRLLLGKQISIITTYKRHFVYFTIGITPQHPTERWLWNLARKQEVTHENRPAACLW